MRLAHVYTPMTREEKVGAPPPPRPKTPGKGGKGASKKAKKAASTRLDTAATAPLPPPLLVPPAGPDGHVAFEGTAEAQLLAKLRHVCTRLVAVAGDGADDPVVRHLRQLGGAQVWGKRPSLARQRRDRRGSPAAAIETIQRACRAL